MVYGVDLLIREVEKIHTTEMGIQRIIRNLKLSPDTDVVEKCKKAIVDPESSIRRNGKNWYVVNSGNEFTVNATSYTIITAHPAKE